MAVRYPIRAVSRLTGISLDTLRAWERRYKVVTPERSERGRLYSDGELQRLMLLRDAVSRGHAIGQVASLSDTELRDLGQRSAEAARSFPVREESAGAGLQPLIHAVELFDSAAANEEIGRLAALMQAPDLVTAVALPLMRVVGDRWRSGAMSIAHEHMASAILRNLLGSLLRLYKPIDPLVRLVLATPAGEQHEFGILAAAMLAAPLGFDPIYLGPNLPAADILQVAEKTGARVIVLGMMCKAPDAEPLVELRTLALETPMGVELWVGGRPLKDQSEALQERVTFIEDFDALGRQLRRLRQVG